MQAECCIDRNTVTLLHCALTQTQILHKYEKRDRRNTVTVRNVMKMLNQRLLSKWIYYLAASSAGVSWCLLN
jgi:hypothetical protein